MKRKIAILLITLLLITLAACGKSAEAPSGTLEEMMSSLYTAARTNMTADEQILFDRCVNFPVADTDKASLFGTDAVEFTEALCSTPQITSIAYQCILLRVGENGSADDTAALIRENADVNRWLCVSAEALVVETRGDVVLFVMAPENTASALSTAFAELK